MQVYTDYFEENGEKMPFNFHNFYWNCPMQCDFVGQVKNVGGTDKWGDYILKVTRFYSSREL